MLLYVAFFLLLCSFSIQNTSVDIIQEDEHNPGYTVVPGELPSVKRVDAFWDHGVAMSSLLYSYAAYCPTTSLTAWNCKWCNATTTLRGFKPVAVIPYDPMSLLAFVGYSSSTKEIVVSFRGTHNLRNWMTDLDGIKTAPYSDPSVKVHAGFNNAWQGFKPSIIKVVGSLRGQFPSFSVLVTGHSLGAAIATLCAVDLSGAHVPSTMLNLHTFGSPRVGTPEFVPFFLSLVPNYTWRFTNNRDPVPHLPTESMGFFHMPAEIWEQRDNTFKTCSTTNGEDPDCSDSLSFDTSVSDHLTYFDITEDCESDDILVVKWLDELEKNKH